MTDLRAGSLTDLRAAVDRVLPSVRDDLHRLVRIPSVSADPAAAGQVRHCADEVAALMRDAGAADVQVLEVGGGAPAVLARWPAPLGAPTVLLYAHHDVQPTGDPGAWHSPPFEPTERDGRLYGRGCADDKAGVAVHLAALRAFDGRPPVGVTVFVEGEEEVGSPTLPAFLDAHRDVLAADVMVLADSTNWQVGVPALTTSLRGLVDCVVTVRTLSHGVHSGVYGGAAPDALTALCRVLASLHDDRGRVAVQGTTVEAPPPPVDQSEEEFRAESGMLDGVELVGSGTLTSRLWTQPAVSVLAIDAPRVAEASNTLVPEATAKVSLRVPPGWDATAAMDALESHLTDHAPWGARVTVTPGAAGQPFAVHADGPAFDAARSAFAEAWGHEPVDIGMGGSIPFVAALAEAFPNAAILVTGVEDPDSRAHGANESVHLGEFARACLAEALLLRALASVRG